MALAAKAFLSNELHIHQTQFDKTIVRNLHPLCDKLLAWQIKLHLIEIHIKRMIWIINMNDEMNYMKYFNFVKLIVKEIIHDFFSNLVWFNLLCVLDLWLYRKSKINVFTLSKGMLLTKLVRNNLLLWNVHS